MEYSKIQSIEIVNFMNIENVKLSFEESPIVALCGDNDSGKTACLLPFAVMAYNAYDRYQQSFVRNGTKGFGIGMVLEDNTRIQMMKFANNGGVIVQVTKSDGTVWRTNKIDRVKGEVSGAPEMVREIMGVVQEPDTKEFLHVRDYNNQLMFIGTPASSNYKMVYTALKLENITRAIKKANVDLRSYKANIDDLYSRLQFNADSLSKIKILDITPVVSIAERLERMCKLEEIAASTYEEVVNIVELSRKNQAYIELMQSGIGEITGYESYYEAGRIISLCNEVEALENTVEKYSGIELAKEIEYAHYATANHILKTISDCSEDIKLFDSMSEVLQSSKEVNEQLANIYFNEIPYIQNELNTINEDEQKLVELNRTIADIEKILKDNNVKVVTCPKCGYDILED